MDLAAKRLDRARAADRRDGTYATLVALENAERAYERAWARERNGG